MARKLDNKVAVVTGASKGIGAGIARRLAADGAAVVVNYASDKAGAERVVAGIKSAGGKAVAVQGDLSKPEGVGKFFEKVGESYDRVDVLVNNAGVYEFAALEEVTAEHYRKQFDLNVLGLLLASKEAVKRMPKGGSIVNISSVVSTYAPPNSAVYSATKGAVDSITRVLAAELGPKGIRVNSVNPGLVETEGSVAAGFAGAEAEFKKKFEAEAPLGRAGTPEDVAGVVAFLASEEAAWTTGQIVAVSGGFK